MLQSISFACLWAAVCILSANNGCAKTACLITPGNEGGKVHLMRDRMGSTRISALAVGLDMKLEYNKLRLSTVL